ncbi:MAG: c-type cytochrome [Myxococcota bacterium]
MAIIKTFSPRWDSESPGTPVEVPPAPELDEAQRAESLTRGRELYSERCARCHDHGLEVPTVWEEPAVSPKLVDYPLKAGASPDVLYRTLAAGIGGVDGKKGLAGELTPSDIWALVFYVQTLAVKAD